MYPRYIKRFMDILGAILALPFLLLLIIPISILIWLEDKGPVFYRSYRLGRNGVPFKMLKFRSMRVNSPDLRLGDGSTYNSETDPRVTRIGAVLRKTSLDEIPQFLNILIGHMSIVGPRPDLNTNVKAYELNFSVLKVKPGITGYTQAYFRNATTWIEKLNYDKYYVDNISFFLDLKILIKTVGIVFKQQNLYRKESKIKDLI